MRLQILPKSAKGNISLIMPLTAVSPILSLARLQKHETAYLLHKVTFPAQRVMRQLYDRIFSTQNMRPKVLQFLWPPTKASKRQLRLLLVESKNGFYDFFVTESLLLGMIFKFHMLKSKYITLHCEAS